MRQLLPHERSFEVLKEYYDILDLAESSAGGPYKKTAVGQFVPSPLLHAHVAIGYLLRTAAIDAPGLFLDAGSGDGRIVGLTALVHGISTVGVEYDNDLAGLSIEHIQSLKHLGLEGASELILRGDFGDDDTYLKAGLRFEDFATVFNYINNERDIATKVAEQSPPGTKLLVLGAFPVNDYQGLTLEMNLEISSAANSEDGIALMSLPPTDDAHVEPFGFYLQVYRR